MIIKKWIVAAAAATGLGVISLGAQYAQSACMGSCPIHGANLSEQELKLDGAGV